MASLPRIPWVIAAAAWALLIFIFSSHSHRTGIPWWLELPFADKVLHAGIFGVFGIFVFLATGRAWVAIIIASLYGATDEWHQVYIDGRIADLWDWVADIIGAGIGVSLLSLSRNNLKGR